VARHAQAQSCAIRLAPHRSDRVYTSR
jgi:hypothetical protein